MGEEVEEKACLDGVDFWHAHSGDMLLDDLVRGIQEIAVRDLRASLTRVEEERDTAQAFHRQSQRMHEAVLRTLDDEREQHRADIADLNKRLSRARVEEGK